MSAIDSAFNNAFFDEDEFAVAAAYKEDGTGDGVSIIVNFFKEGEPVPTDGGNVEMDHPVCMAKTSDVVNADHDSVLVIDSVTYYVTVNSPDGTGISILHLSENQIT